MKYNAGYSSPRGKFQEMLIFMVGNIGVHLRVPNSFYDFSKKSSGSQFVSPRTYSRDQSTCQLNHQKKCAPLEYCSCKSQKQQCFVSGKSIKLYLRFKGSIMWLKLNGIKVSIQKS